MNKYIDLLVDLQPTEIDLDLDLSQSIGGSNNYEDLTNKPKINDVTVVGNKTFEEYGLFSLSNMEILETFNKIFK